MDLTKTLIALSIIGFVTIPVQSSAAVNNPPVDATVVNLRTTCTEGGVEVPNCFNDLAVLENWMNNVRTASALLVKIGPGTFVRARGNITGALNCSRGNLTLEGSGRTQTILAASLGGYPSAGIAIFAGCDNLNVQDLKITGWLQGAVVNNVSAKTTWTNVELEGGNYGWLETGTCPNHNGRHTWNSSRIVGLGAASGNGISITYTSTCAQSWFFGSEIVANETGSGTGSFALEATDAEVHLYGSNARLIVGTGANADQADLIRALTNSVVHIHGTGLDVVHNGSGNVAFLRADATSHFHANASGFSLHNNGTGTVARLAGAGAIEAPYQWGQQTSPPAIISRSGADTYVETDCPNTGNCSTGGTFPHTMVYRAECTGTGANQGPWYDTVTNACRQ